MIKMRNRSQIVKDRKVLSDVVQNNKNTCKVVVEEEGGIGGRGGGGIGRDEE